MLSGLRLLLCCFQPAVHAWVRLAHDPEHTSSHAGIPGLSHLCPSISLPPALSFWENKVVKTSLARQKSLPGCRGGWAVGALPLSSFPEVSLLFPPCSFVMVMEHHSSWFYDHTHLLHTSPSILFPSSFSNLASRKRKERSKDKRRWKAAGLLTNPPPETTVWVSLINGPDPIKKNHYPILYCCRHAQKATGCHCSLFLPRQWKTLIYPKPGV